MTDTINPVTTDLSHAHLNVFNIFRSEWKKLWSLRSSYFTLTITVLLYLLIAVATTVITPDGLDYGGYVGNGASLSSGIFFAQISLIVLAVMSITSEWGTGAIRTTFATVPKRTSALVSKMLVAAVVTFVTISLSILLTYGIGSLKTGNFLPNLTSPIVWATIAGTCFSMIILVIMAQGIGLLLRNTAATISIFFTVQFVFPIVFAMLGGLISWAPTVSKFFPSTLVNVVATPYSDLGMGVSFWTAVAALTAWALVPWIIGLVLAKVRDV